MKIANICLCGPYNDGFSYQDNYLPKYHKRLGHEVWLIASEWAFNDKGEMVISDETEYDNNDGVHVIRLHSKFGKLGSFLRLYPDIVKTIERIKPDVLFIHGCSFWSIRRLVPYLKRNRTVVYVDNHADYSNSARNWLSKNVLHKIVWRSCARKIEPYTRRFYGVLPARVDFLKELYGLPADKCELLVMGADDDAVKAAARPEVRKSIREKYGIAADDFLIMTGGKIDLFKTQTILLMQAVQQIKDPKVKLIVFGSVVPELKEKVAAVADGRKVQYIGWVKSDDSYPLFAAADLVVFPGRHSVFWEQVAGQGIPMLVKDWAGTHHVDMGGNVRFLKQDSSEEIEKMLTEIINDPEEYQKMKDIAVGIASKQFSYSNIAKNSIEQ